MPSLQIKDYIIAGLLVALLIAGITIGYDKTRMSIMTKQLDNAKLLAEESERKNKLIVKRTEQEKREADEQHDSDISSLNAELKRMRDSNASILPAITKAARDINEIKFKRDELDRALQEFREEIRGIAAKGAECEIEIKTLQNWWYNVESIYGNQ